MTAAMEAMTIMSTSSDDRALCASLCWLRDQEVAPI
jgi:hypothetical protein